MMSILSFVMMAKFSFLEVFFLLWKLRDIHSFYVDLEYSFFHIDSIFSQLIMHITRTHCSKHILLEAYSVC